jgi:hypothetical protein
MINVDRHVAEIEDEGDQDYGGHRPRLEAIPEVPIRIGEGAAQQQKYQRRTSTDKVPVGDRTREYRQTKGCKRQVTREKKTKTATPPN